VIELDDGHGDEGDQKMIECFTFEKKRKKKTKIGSRQRYL
jgi:hypothetical protein